MPPSPRVDATLNEELYAELCVQLRVPVPPVTFRPSTTEGKWYGLYHHSNHITVFLGVSGDNLDGLKDANDRVVSTLLHELRHAWQKHHAPELRDDVVGRENDANDWAARTLPKVRTLVRLKRTFPNSGFSRLSRHSRRAV